MDKRWIYILIILIIGISCLFLIAESSTTIGKATVKVGSYLITIPDSFNIDTTGGNNTHLINRNTHEYIIVEDLGKGDFIDDNMGKKMSDLQNSGKNKVVENITVEIDNSSIPTIYYEDYNNTFNQISYTIKYNHTFSIRSTHFHDNNTLKENTKFIIDTLSPNYKQKQD